MSEIEQGSFMLDSDDPTILAVKGYFENKDDYKRYVESLSKAILTVYQKHNEVKLRCIGSASISNAVNAHVQAAANISKQGDSVALVPSFTKVKLNENDEFMRTAVVLKVVKL